MRIILLMVLACFVSACSVSLPQKEKAPSTWRMTPPNMVSEVKKEPALVIARPWVASGFETPHVIVSTKSGEMDILADVSWPDNHGEWIRNYFLEGLQSSGLFSSVSANYKMRSQHWAVQLYLWDLSVQYSNLVSKGQPVVNAKITYSVSDGRGNKLVEQTTVTSRQAVAENRVEPIMAGFEKAIAECYSRLYATLERL